LKILSEEKSLTDKKTQYDNKYDPLQAFIDLFKDVDSVGEDKQKRADMTLEERLRSHIIDGEKEGLAETIDEAMEKFPPLTIINEHLLDGMKVVGELFGAGKMQLPFVLQSAEVMKMAVARLEPHMEKIEGKSKGSIVLATVKGDVHDIGKNLVDIILSNNGYTVHNIGIKQPLSNIMAKWEETKADAIGLSGLLVKSVNVMEENLVELNELGVKVPVILGGAALTRHYAEGRLRGQYQGSLYYGKDAFEGLRLMDFLSTGRGPEIDKEIEERLGKRAAAEETIAKAKAREGAKEEVKTPVAVGAGGGGGSPESPARSDVAPDVSIPTAPFWGSRIVEGIDLDEVYPFINPVALFRGQWQFKKGAMSDPEYQAMLEDKVYPIFERYKARCKEDGILQPKVVYGYYPCQSEGDDLIIYDPASVGVGGESGSPSEIERFEFPRQAKRKRLCISDFFRSVDSGEMDVVALTCVTVGSRASEEAKKLFEANDYTEYLYLHGFGVETAEALAELWHKRIRQEMGIGADDSAKMKELFTQKYRGSRYSFGYPACPEMSDQEKLFRLIDPERIGCVLTENWQIDPEQSTSAIVVHHPEAKYFNV